MNSIKKHWRTIAVLSIPPLTALVTVIVLMNFNITNTSSNGTDATHTQSIDTDGVALGSIESDSQTTPQYGDKYANGILPVGDYKYSTSSPKKGQIYLCHAPRSGEGGAGTRGPWFINNNTEYDITKKPAVSGSIKWDGNYTMSITNGKRIITTNDVPDTHTTGTFPIQSSDSAYLYDRNPNSIKLQTLTYSLPSSPTQLATPGCIGGEVGIMTTGVALFDAFDAGGRDAGAWEVQDSCAGHPQEDGEYHYHTLSSCITDVSSKTVIGYALDGYPITGPTVMSGNIITTDDLDECHGMTSQIVLDGKTVDTYHYVMTQDFPYSVSCFRGSATNAPH